MSAHIEDPELRRLVARLNANCSIDFRRSDYVTLPPKPYGEHRATRRKPIQNEDGLFVESARFE